MRDEQVQFNFDTNMQRQSADIVGKDISSSDDERQNLINALHNCGASLYMNGLNPRRPLRPKRLWNTLR
jgi:hypothetical protein